MYRSWCMPGDQRTTLGVPPQTGSIVLNCVGQADWPMISRNSVFCTSHFTSGMTDAHLTLHLAPRGPSSVLCGSFSGSQTCAASFCSAEHCRNCVRVCVVVVHVQVRLHTPGYVYGADVGCLLPSHPIPLRQDLSLNPRLAILTRLVR